MLMIVGSHLAFHGIWRSQQNDAFVVYHMGSQINQWINSFLCVGGQTGVAIFFIITGYYQINRNFNLKSIKNIYYQCVFYSLLSLVIYLMILPWGGDGIPILNAGVKAFRSLVVPILGGSWWFVTSYVFVLFISPVVNSLIKELHFKACLQVVIVCYLLVYVCSYILEAPYYNIQKGVFFYLIGAFTRLHLDNRKKTGRILNLIIIMFVWIFGAVLYYLVASLNTTSIEFSDPIMRVLKTGLNTLIVSVVAPVCAFETFILMKKTDIGKNATLNKIASTTFGIYLFHDSWLGYYFIWNNVFTAEAVFLNKLYPFIAAALIIGIFAFCSLVDIMRQKIFRAIFNLS